MFLRQECKSHNCLKTKNEIKVFQNIKMDIKDIKQTNLSEVPLVYSINRGVTSCLEYLEFTVTKSNLN